MATKQRQTETGLPDAELARKFLETGEERHFAAIVRRHVSGVHSFLRSSGIEDEHVDDVAQEVFIGLYSSLGRWRGEAPLSVWIFAIAWRQIRRFRRGMLYRAVLRPLARRPDMPDPVDRLVAPGGDALDDLTAAEERAEVRAALARLPERQRAALALRYFEGFKLDEVAGALGITVGTAKATVFKGLRNMEKILGGNDGERH